MNNQHEDDLFYQSIAEDLLELCSALIAASSLLLAFVQGVL